MKRNTLEEGNSDDDLFGGPGDDILRGDDGADSLVGNEGDDRAIDLNAAPELAGVRADSFVASFVQVGPRPRRPTQARVVRSLRRSFGLMTCNTSFCQ